MSGVHLDHRDARNSVSDIRGCQKRCKNYLFIANWGWRWCVGVLTNWAEMPSGWIYMLVECRGSADAYRAAAFRKIVARRQDSNGPCAEFWSWTDQSECLLDGRCEVATPAKFYTPSSRSAYLRLAAKPTSGPGLRILSISREMGDELDLTWPATTNDSTIISTITKHRQNGSSSFQGKGHQLLRAPLLAQRPGVAQDHPRPGR